MQQFTTYLATLPLPMKIIVLTSLAIFTHFLVISIRQVAKVYFHQQRARASGKLRTVITLATSALIFTLYFLTLGLILKEFGVSIKAYLASASVLGLALGYGSQGFVQDIVTGLTFIFSDLVDVGDLVEISAQTGIVKGITLRFVELENAMGASVFIPNRTINNVINYPRGYVRCIVDVTLLGDATAKDAIQKRAVTLSQNIPEQFPGILMTQPTIEGRKTLSSGKEYLRIKFRIWPNRGQPIETSFLQELIADAKKVDPDYAVWMVSITYEVEDKTKRPLENWPWKRKERVTKSLK